MTFKFIKFDKSVSLKKYLNKKLSKNTNVFRYNFHKNNSDKEQLMMIWQRKNYFFPPKKFLDTSKTYFLLKGKLDVFIFNSKGKIIQTCYLSQLNPVCRIKRNVYHCDVAKSKIAIHCEITNHSFLGRKMKFLDNKYFLKIKNFILKKY
tara:strand:- start:1261 stop:1707 length:447 start_codon:yes stop_codon:yes gene_type:complete